MRKCGFLAGEIGVYKYAMLPGWALRALALFQEAPEPLGEGRGSGADNDDDPDLDKTWELALGSLINLMKRAPRDIRYRLLRRLLLGRTERLT